MTIPMLRVLWGKQPEVKKVVRPCPFCGAAGAYDVQPVAQGKDESRWLVVAKCANQECAVVMGTTIVVPNDPHQQEARESLFEKAGEEIRLKWNRRFKA